MGETIPAARITYSKALWQIMYDILKSYKKTISEAHEVRGENGPKGIEGKIMHALEAI